MSQNLPKDIENAIRTILPGATQMKKLKDGTWDITWNGTTLNMKVPVLSYIKVNTTFNIGVMW